LPTLTNLVISGNTSYYGGGIYNSSSSLVLSKLFISGNSANYGGGIFNASGSSDTLFMYNTLISGNTASSSGGGIFNQSGTSMLTNLTVAGNIASSGGGVYRNGAVNLRNSIIWGNTRSDGNVNNVYGSPVYSYSLVEDIYPTGTGNLNGSLAVNAPQFVDASVGNYRLRAGSSAVDKGNNSYNIFATDIDGNPRVKGCAIELGPYETQDVTPDANGIVYVTENGTGDGSSWSKAYGGLADPLSAAQYTTCIRQIWVAEGTYKPSRRADDPQNAVQNPDARDNAFVPAADVKIYGGFSADYTGTTPPPFGSDDRSGESVLSGEVGNPSESGDNVYHVMIVSGDMGDALLDGFTLSGGYGDGIDSITVNGRKFARHNGGGIYVHGTMTFSNLKVKNNSATNSGGGVFLDGDDDSDIVVITNAAVFDNFAGDKGGGVYAHGGTAYLTNLTVADNQSGGSGGGIHSDGSSFYLRNSIVWGNTSPNVSGSINYSRNLVEDGAVDGAGIVSADDPLFEDAANGDYDLQLGSPAVNRGDNAFYDAGKQPDLSALTTDLAGNPRIYGRNIDLGVFEVQSLPVAAVNDTALTTVDTPVTIKVLANDDLDLCSDTQLDVFDTVVGYGPKYGTVVFNVDTLIYTPDAGHFGIDSLDYTFECIGNATSARGYILTVNPLSKQYYACPDAQVTIGFKAVADVSYEWLAADMTTVIESSSNTITVTKDNSGNMQTYYARPSWKEMEFPLDTIELFPAADVTPAVSDIRVALCPTPSREVYLTQFLDSLPYATGAVQWSSTGMSPAVDASTGAVNTANFPRRGAFAYSYTRYSECATTSAKAVAYVHVAHSKIPHRPDTVAFCLNRTGTINVNSIFGLELGGSWTLSDNVVINNTSTNSAGAIIFNVQKAYQDVKNNAAYDATYRGAAGKGFVFEYDYSAGSCASGTKRMTIVVVDN
jgi:hypothetical protein